MPMRPSRRQIAALVLGSLTVAAIGGFLAHWLTARIALPPPGSNVTAAPPDWDAFAGSEACRDCHRSQYDRWRGSTHGRAGGAPSPETVIARFDGATIRFKDARVTPSRGSDGAYQFAVEQAGRPRLTFRVSGVIGRGHLLGGGTQGFLADFPDGTLRFLPFDFIRRERRWFCNTIGRGNRGWVAITADLPIAACVDWPPQRVVGTDQRFSNCQECHGSQIQLRYEPAARRYLTRVRSLTINCESCHGPARRHVEMARSGALDTAATIGVGSLATLNKDQALEVCFRCHALKDVLEPRYLPGARFAAHYSLGLPALGDRPWYPDGRVRTFGYQENHRFSDCYVNGSMTCVDCHEPHGQGYRDASGRPLPGRFDDGQCVGCHPSKADRAERHTHHRADSRGSRCVACHMPYRQHPELGNALRYARSDHTIAIPRPGADERRGVESACRQCHGDQPVERLAEVTRTWYGELKPRSPLIDALETVTPSADLASAGRMLLRPDLDLPPAQLAALDLLLDGHLQPDQPSLDRGVVEALERLARSRDRDVRALALAALHFAGGERPAVRSFLARVLRDLGDEEALIRRRWVVSLGFLGDRYREQGAFEGAVLAYQKALEISPEDASVLANLGASYAGAGDPRRAVERYRQSLRVDPVQPLTLVNLGLALEALDDPDEAAAAYRQALDLNPWEAVALLDLGNVYLRRGDVPQAVGLYRRAIKANSGLPLAHFNLARALAVQGQLREAVTELRWGLEFEPEDAEARQLLTDLMKQGGR